VILFNSPHRKTAHKAIVIVNTMMNEKRKDVAVVGTEIVEKKKED